MSTYQLRKTIKRELENLNHKIDQKIVRGRGYAWEARKHKELLSRLYNIDKAASRNWFGVVSSFLF